MSERPVIALSGGVGGAKLVLGLAHVLPGDRLTVVTNTGDDFDHLGLRICPDTDTVLYTLSGLADPDKGWGRAGETWTFMRALAALGGEDWFSLGDGDLALHVLRTHRLSEGASLGEVTAEVADVLNIAPMILPMSDQPVATHVNTPDGQLAFQHYFVRERCAPVVTGFEFKGVDAAKPNPELVQQLETGPEAIIIAPSNPYISVDPILGLPGLWAMLRACGAPIIAISPIVGGGGDQRAGRQDDGGARHRGFGFGYRSPLPGPDRRPDHRRAGQRPCLPFRRNRYEGSSSADDDGGSANPYRARAPSPGLRKRSALRITEMALIGISSAKQRAA